MCQIDMQIYTKLKRILSTLLVFAVILSCVGWLPVRAQSAEIESPEESAQNSSEFQQEQTQTVRVSLLYDEEGDDLNRLVYLNSDGSRTMELYDFPVKFRDSDGTIRDISLEIAEGTQPLARYFTAQGRAVTSFPTQLADGIRLSDGQVSIKLTPCLPLNATAGPQHVLGYTSQSYLHVNVSKQFAQYLRNL